MAITSSRLLFVLVFFGLAGCRPSSSRGLEVPPGTEIVLNRIDGSVVSGRLIGVESGQVVVRGAAGQDVRVAYSDVASVRATLAVQNASKRSEKPSSTTASRAPAETSSTPAAGFKDFQVAAGTRLSIELSTALASEVSQVDDQVKGRLREALMVDGVELVPAGSVVLGTVTEAARAVRDQDRGRIAVRFSVIQHPGTGSRVAIRTAPLAFEAESTLKNARANAARAPADSTTLSASEVRLNPGTTVSATLLEPFVVRIPVT